MLRLILVGAVALVALLLVATVAVVKLFGWLAIPVLLVGLVALAWAGKVVAGKALVAAFKMPFKAKGSVLRGATARIHAVEPCDAPKNADYEIGEDDVTDPGTDLRYYRIDMTITPQPATGKFTAWEPGEIVLVGPDAKPDDVDEETSYGIAELEVWEDGAFAADEGFKYEGERRVRFVAGIPPALTHARFRYYFELFGDVAFPRRG